jgi:hypothetical protein
MNTGTPLAQRHVRTVPEFRTISASGPSRSQALHCEFCGIRDARRREDVYVKINFMYLMLQARAYEQTKGKHHTLFPRQNIVG